MVQICRRSELLNGCIEVRAFCFGSEAGMPRAHYVCIWICCAADADSCYRWLNNEQALEDSANFMCNVKFKAINEDLTAPNTPWIYYGVRMPCR